MSTGFWFPVSADRLHFPDSDDVQLTDEERREAALARDRAVEDELNELRRGVVRVYSSEPADGALLGGQVAAWVDEAADVLHFKVKYTDGTIMNADVALFP